MTNPATLPAPLPASRSIPPFALSLLVHASLVAIALFTIHHDHDHYPNAVVLTPIELVGASSEHAGPGTKSRKPAPKRAANPAEPVIARDEPPAKAPSADVVATSQASPQPQAAQPEGGNGGGASAGSPLQAYVHDLVERVDRTKIYPEEAAFRAEEGRVVVALRIRPDGSVEHFHVAEPCPFDSLNHAALDAIARLGKLPPLPNGRIAPLTLHVPLLYQLARNR